MNDSNQESKTSAIKTLAIIGFITAIVFFVWLAVQVVRVAPTAFHSLASLAETVYGSKQPFEITIATKVVNVGDPLTVTWKKINRPGTYTFSYRCTEGISAQARDAQGAITNISCETPFTITGNTEHFDVSFASEKKRFIDVPVTLAFTPEGTEVSEERNDLVTIVNATFADNNTPTTVVPPVVETPTPTPEPTKPVVATTPVKPVVRPVTPVIISTVPVSDPNGYTDLRTLYLGIGEFNETTKVFTPTAVLHKDTRGAIRFEVKNIGTKTSGTWTYSAILPNSGNQVYTSPAQEPLKPQERAVVMLAFGDLTQSTGNDTVQVNVTGGGDTTPLNNGFTWTIQIAR